MMFLERNMIDEQSPVDSVPHPPPFQPLPYVLLSNNLPGTTALEAGGVEPELGFLPESHLCFTQ